MISEPIAIRFYRIEDARLLHEAAMESMAEVSAWLQWCHPGFTLAEAESWIAAHPDMRKRGNLEFAIVDAAGRYLGGCGINQVNLGHRFANLGYWVRTPATGRGVASAAVRLLAAHVFEHTTLERLEIVVATGNAASERVAEKAGAVREGVLRDRLFMRGKPHDATMFSLVRSDWPPPSLKRPRPAR